MKITLEDVGRRYNHEWIFRHMNYTFSSGSGYAILGPNGSGKSTLLKILCGSLSTSEGKLNFHKNSKPIHADVSYAAPYMELIEEFSLDEMLDFHFRFKKFRPGFDKKSVLDILDFKRIRDKHIRHFSSGMKQRLRLALACCAQSELLILDEPMSNLDEEGEGWYHNLLKITDAKSNLLLIGSNQLKEYSICQNLVYITEFK